MAKKDKKGKDNVTRLPVKKKASDQAEEKETKDQADEEKFVLTNGDIDALLSNDEDGAISPLSNFIRLRTIPREKSFQLEALDNKLQGTFQVITSQKMKIIEKYGQRDEKGKLIQSGPGLFKIGNMTWANKELATLMRIENKIEWEKIKIDRKADLPERGVSARDIMIMRKVVDFVEMKDGKQEPV